MLSVSRPFNLSRGSNALGLAGRGRGRKRVMSEREAERKPTRGGGGGDEKARLVGGRPPSHFLAAPPLLSLSLSLFLVCSFSLCVWGRGNCQCMKPQWRRHWQSCGFRSALWRGSERAESIPHWGQVLRGGEASWNYQPACTVDMEVPLNLSPHLTKCVSGPWPPLLSFSLYFFFWSGSDRDGCHCFLTFVGVALTDLLLLLLICRCQFVFTCCCALQTGWRSWDSLLFPFGSYLVCVVSESDNDTWCRRFFV